MSESSYEKRQRVDRAADKSEAGLAAGKQPLIENYLLQAPDLDEQLFEALLDLEIELLAARPPLANYLQRFPQFKDNIERALLEPTHQEVQKA